MEHLPPFLFPRMKPNPADPPLQLSLLMTSWAIMFHLMMLQRQTQVDWGMKMHIQSVYAGHFNVLTAVILPYVHEKEDMSWSLRAPPDLSPARKTSISAPALCKTHVHIFYGFKVAQTCATVCTEIPPPQYCQRYVIESGWTSNTGVWQPHRNPASTSKNSLKYLIKRQITVNWIKGSGLIMVDE